MKFFLPGVILLFCLPAKSQTVISGKVIDDLTHQPLEGVTVVLLPSREHLRYKIECWF